MKTVANYRIQFSPEAWQQVGAMHREDFERLHRAIERARQLEAAVVRPAGPEGVTPLRPVLHVGVDDLGLVFERDDEQRTLTLLQVKRRLGETG
jgi:hypothetical protein